MQIVATQEEKKTQRRIFHPAPLVTFQPERGAHFNLYLAVPTRGGQRYVLYKSADLDMTQQNREDLITRGVRFLYVTDEDAPAYFSYVDRTLGELLTSDKVSPEKKSQMLYETTSALVRATFARPDSPMLIKTNRTLIEHTTKLIVSEPGAFRTMVSMLALDYSLYTHSVNVSTIGTGLLLELDVAHADEIPGIALGFLMHDIGKSRVPAEILRKTGILSKPELKEIEKHPIHGVDIMQAHEHISPRAIEIIQSHHEKLDGRGYPYHLPAGKISLETRICSAADVFDALTSNRPYKKAMTAFETMQLIMSRMSHELDTEIVSMLVHILGPRKGGGWFDLSNP